MYERNDWLDSVLATQHTGDYLAHSAKGTVWKDKLYSGKTPGGTYIYPLSVRKNWSSYKEAQGGRGRRNAPLFGPKPSARQNTGTTRRNNTNAGSGADRVQKYATSAGPNTPKFGQKGYGQYAINRGVATARNGLNAAGNAIGINQRNALNAAQQRENAARSAEQNARMNYKNVDSMIAGNNRYTEDARNAENKAYRQLTAAQQERERRQNAYEQTPLGKAEKFVSPVTNAISDAGRAVGNFINPPKLGTDPNSTIVNERLLAANDPGGSGGLRQTPQNRYTIGNAIGNALSDAGQWIGDRAQDVGNAARNAWDQFTDYDGRIDKEDLARIPTSIGNRLENFGNSARDAIRERIEDFGNTEFGDNLYNAIGDARANLRGAYDRFTGGDGLDIGDFGRAAGSAANNIRDRVSGAYNRFTGGDGLDIGDFGRAAGNAVGAAGKFLGDRAQDAARAAYDTYDRIKGNDRGDSWGRVTGYDDHLSKQDIIDRIGDRTGLDMEAIGNKSRQLFDAAGNRVNDIRTNIGNAAKEVGNFMAGQDYLRNARYWQDQYEKTGNPDAKNMADSYMTSYRQVYRDIPTNIGNTLRNVGNAVTGTLNSVGNGAAEIRDNIGKSTGLYDAIIEQKQNQMFNALNNQDYDTFNRLNAEVEELKRR